MVRPLFEQWIYSKLFVQSRRTLFYPKRLPILNSSEFGQALPSQAQTIPHPYFNLIPVQMASGNGIQRDEELMELTQETSPLQEVIITLSELVIDH